LKKYKDTQSKEKMEIHSHLGWKHNILFIGDGALISDGYLYHIYLGSKRIDKKDLAKEEYSFDEGQLEANPNLTPLHSLEKFWEVKKV